MKKKWSAHLLAIPKILVVDIVAFMIAAFIDIKMLHSSQSQGHGAPVATMIVIMVFSAITLGVTVYSLVRAGVAYVNEKKETDDKETETVNFENTAHNNDKKSGKYLIAIPIQAIVSMILVYMCGSYEINSFYNDPNHIGFAIPVMTFLLAGALFILFLLTTVIMIFFYRRSRKRR